MHAASAVWRGMSAREEAASLERQLRSQARGRQRVVDTGGRTVYEWAQTLEDVQIFVPLPASCGGKQSISVNLSPRKLQLFLHGTVHLDATFSELIDASNSFWYKDGLEVVIECSKARPEETWVSCFRGHTALNPVLEREMKKNLVLERFQNEHPTFDFSGATFSGDVPDARTFMRNLGD